MAYEIALFDLDGTITNSAPVITTCVNTTLRELGIPEQLPNELPRWVGPPLAVSFSEFAKIPQAGIENAIKTYRSHYRQSMFESEVFPGVRQCLAQLKSAGVRLAVATSKHEKYAIEIIKYQNLGQYFEITAGALSDSANYTKATVIRSALTRLGLANPLTVPPRAGEIAMIGDRHHDIDGGRENHLDTIGITWSGTNTAEFANATAIAHTPSELAALIVA